MNLQSVQHYKSNLFTVDSFDICWTIAILQISSVFALASIAFFSAGYPCAAVGSFPARCATAERLSVDHAALSVVIASGHPARVILSTIVTIETSFTKAALV